MKAGLTEASGVGAKRTSIPFHFLDAVEGLAESLHRGARHQHAGHPVDNSLEGTATSKRNHRTAGGIRFERYKPEILFAGLDQRRATAEEARQLPVAHVGAELDVRPRLPSKNLASRTLTDDHQAGAPCPARGNGQVDALIGKEPTDNEVVGPAAGRLHVHEAADVEGRVHHGRRAPVVAPDALGDDA